MLVDQDKKLLNISRIECGKNTGLEGEDVD
jgi:hypothetical protein